MQSPVPRQVPHMRTHTLHHAASSLPSRWVPAHPPQAADHRPTCSARNRAFNQYTRTTNSSQPSSNRSRWDEANDSCRRSPRKWAPGKSGPNLPLTTPAGQFRGDTENHRPKGVNLMCGAQTPFCSLRLPPALSPWSLTAPEQQRARWAGWGYGDPGARGPHSAD